MEIKVVKIGSLEEFKEFMKSLENEMDDGDCECASKDAERGVDEATARYDRFIDLLLDLIECAVDCGNFKRDCELFREHMHEAPIHVKRAFFRNFEKELEEPIRDIMELTAEYAWLKSYTEKKKSSDVKNKDKKPQEKNSNKERK